ncbi:MAG: site-specific DNA-methyltransferase [Alphaproteobacteria bacterium]
MKQKPPLPPREGLERIKVNDLKPHERNARTHSKKQIRQIADSIERFGFTNPVLADARNRIIAGHGRIEAAKLLKMADVPVIRIERFTEAERRAYIIADNRLAELAGWDDELLALELGEILKLEPEFDTKLIGFDTAEVEKLLNALDGTDVVDAEVEIDETGPPVSRIGDLWQLGRHRLICGDALDARVYQRLLDGKRAQMVFTDPPYNVPIDGNVCGLGKVKHEEFVMASGEMSEAEFTEFLTGSMRNLADFSEDGSIHFICMDWRHLQEMLAAGRTAYEELKNLIVWNKDNGGMGAFYRSKHELIFAFKKGTAPHINNFGLGQHGRYRTNVWDYAGVNSLKAERDEELAMHPTVKPVAMVADAIRDCSKRKGIILDAFCGSGTTIIAAEQTGRIGCGIELDPRYVDVAIRRWQKLTDGQALLAGSDLKFDDAHERDHGLNKAA